MKIRQIYIYPIKSLRGVPLRSAQATRTGFKYDRRFMLLKVIPADNNNSSDNADANAKTGETTLKNMHVPHLPEMALFETQLFAPDSDKEIEEGEGEEDEKGRVSVRYHPPGSESESGSRGKKNDREEDDTIDIPLTPDTRGLEELAVMMHKSPTKGYNMGSVYNNWFSQRFGYEVVLAYLGDENSRAVLGSFPPLKHAGHRAYQKQQKKGIFGAVLKSLNFLLLTTLLVRFWSGDEWDSSMSVGLSSGLAALLAYLFVWRTRGQSTKDERITFADAAPYMIISSTSVANVTDRLEGEEEMDVKKFRANVVVEGAESAFEEDFWAELVIGEDKVRLLLTANCLRCRSLDVDYGTGTFATGEAGKVLKKLMSDRRVDRGAKYSPVFGRYAFLAGESDLRTVRVGDEVVVARKMNERSVHDWPGMG